MQTPDQPILRDIVLIGGGHSHVVVLKSFGMNPIAGVRITLICTDLHTPYSGMLPGYVAGHYAFDAVHIDLARLAAFAGARLYHDEVIGIDRAKQKVLCKNRPAVAYDQLSINIGSTPQLHNVPGAAEHAVAVKPIRNFNDRWLQLLERVKTPSRHPSGKTTIAVVGAGAGGVELLLAMQYRLRNELSKLGRNPDELHFLLLTSSHTILPTHNARVRRWFNRVLAQRGVQVHLEAEAMRVDAGVNTTVITTAKGQQIQADEVIWVTRAGGAAWLKSTGLQLDDDGFIDVQDTLQTVTDPLVFAAGDIANMVNFKLEKAGVFAVRQGKPLAENLRLAVSGTALKRYQPQSRWLALISTGDKYAVASRGWLGFAGSWVWQWKDGIDQRFMRKFSQFPPMPATAASPQNATQGLALNAQESVQAQAAMAMRCGGCGAKVGANVLQNALNTLQVVQRDDVLLGLQAADDAAVVRVPAGMLLVQTVDFFRAFIDDPYTFGKVAANHALGDIWAMGASAQTATAIATVPPGIDAKVQDTLVQMMTGAIEVLNEAQCALVGGHSAEGQELALGFAINGLIAEPVTHQADPSGTEPPKVLRKSGMQVGDVLILTKPLGTGTLFAAHDRYAAKGRWIEAATQSMLQSNQSAAHILRQHGATACTDITGFGLLGHLLGMTRPSNTAARIQLSSLPLLDGALDCLAAGITSSLHQSNETMRDALQLPAALAQHPRYAILFDPQTAGGLLASVPASQAQACINSLHAKGYLAAAQIGQVLPASKTFQSIELID